MSTQRTQYDPSLDETIETITLPNSTLTVRAVRYRKGPVKLQLNRQGNGFTFGKVDRLYLDEVEQLRNVFDQLITKHKDNKGV